MIFLPICLHRWLQTIESELELTQQEGEKGALMRDYRRRVSSFSFVLFNLFIFAIQISGEIIKSSWNQ